MARKVRTAEMSWREVEAAIARGAVALVPMGSTEEHGPHVPTGDYLIADVIAERVAAATDAVMTPVIPFSYSEYFRHYPGTVTLQASTMRAVVYDIVTGLLDQGFRHVVLLNGHKGNEPILLPLIRKIRRERGMLVPVVAPLGFGLTPALQAEIYGDKPTGHGGEPIGSIQAYLNPELVDLERAEEWGTQPFQGQSGTSLNGFSFAGRPVLLALNMEDITPPSGSLSDPRLASADRGERIVTSAVEGLTAFVEWFKTIDPSVTP
ncbi:MAG TPA: creatininase family protein [Thermomicrobiaceae bacterium]|nr:creatininase family protein [Thermomicrobiaceae bacterium]